MPPLRKAVLISLFLFTSFIWYSVFSLSDSRLRVSFLDVGQGDATFIETPTGNQILIDGGPGRNVLARLGKILPVHDRSIDVVVATHTDFDHLSGLVEILKSYRVDLVLENSFQAETGIYKEWDALIKEKNIPRRIVSAGDRLVLDEGIWLDILGPFSDDFEPLPLKANEVMIVSRLVAGDNEFLFAGDIEKGDELRLARSGFELASDVLKIAHHGSRTSSSNLFLEKVSPHYGVISVGVQNRYGHPHVETLARLALRNIVLFRTDRDGMVTFISDGKNILPVAVE